MTPPSLPDAHAVLNQLDGLERGSSTSDENRATARHWATLIKESQAFLDDRSHSIVFIGSVGVGKSSLISVLSSLLVGPRPSDRASLKENSVLAIGSGRTTVCEVRIRASRATDSGTIGLIVEPYSVPDMTKELELYAQSEWRRRHSDVRSKGEDDLEQFPQEIQRAIRGIIDYEERQEIYFDDTGAKRRRTIRPLDDVIPRFSSEQEFTHHLIERANLPARTEVAWWSESLDEPSLKELKARFEAVNQGSEATAMLPRCMTVVVPMPLPGSMDLELTLIDTRGLDGTLESRRDLQGFLRDPRAIFVLCAPFKDAPGDTLRALMASLANNAELRPAIPRTRLVLLDHGDADQVNGADGDRESGQDLKIEECLRALEAAALSPRIERSQILAFDALKDEPLRVLSAINGSLAALRKSRDAAFQQQLSDARRFLDNAGDELRSTLRESVDQQLRETLAKHVPAGAPLTDPLAGLYEAIQECRYASIVYAACKRNGSYSRLDLYAAVEAEAARAATSWLEELMTAATDRLNEFLSAPTYEYVQDHIRLRKHQFEEGHLAVIRMYATQVSQEVQHWLSDDPVWRLCADEWGMSGGFKARVLEHLQAWSERHILDAHEHTEAHRTIPLLGEVTRIIQAPRFTLRVENLRALYRVNWTPEPVSALIGANGAGKSTLLQTLRLLRLAYERGLPEAVTQILGGSSNLKSWKASEEERIRLALDIGSATWQIELTPRNGSVDYLTHEQFIDNGREVFSSDAMGAFLYRNERIEPSRLLGLRTLIDRGVHDPVLRRFASFVQHIAVFHDPDLWSLRSGSRTADDRQLQSRSANALTLLRRWQQERNHRERYQFVVEGLSAAFPNAVSDLDFLEAGNTLVARVYRKGREQPTPLADEANGVLQLLVLFCDVASIEDEGVVAIDEPENSLHPYALGVFLRRTSRWAKLHHLTILLATHSTVLLDELPPEQVYVMKAPPDAETIPTRLDQLCNPDWLAEFKVGDLYEQGEIGSNKDPA